MRKIKLLFFGIIIFLLPVFISSCVFQNGYVNEPNTVSVHFLDVGQGECAIIQLPENKVMMIDAGENGQEDEIIDYIDKLKIKKIDYLVATHPHSDHIGGMEEIITEYDVGEIYMPNAVATSNTFENTIDVIENKGMEINQAYEGKVIFDYSDVKAEILSPVKDEEYSNLNDYSVVIKLEYKENSFLFTGDAEKKIEKVILENYDDLECDVLKVGHHGSDTASTKEFIECVNPIYAVISCGKGNEYGHPHKETLNRLKKAGVEVLRTDKMGTIIIKTDGKNVSIER